MYILSVKKQETGQKTGKNPPKKGVFISSSDQLAEPGHESWQLSWPRAPKLATFVGQATKVGNFRGLAIKVGQRG